MRIALFTETYLPHINGVVTHVKILRDGLLQQGHEVLVVTADYQTASIMSRMEFSIALPSRANVSMDMAWLPL